MNRSTTLHSNLRCGASACRRPTGPCVAVTGQIGNADVLRKRTWHAEVLDRWKCLDANGTRPTLVVRRPWVAVGKGRDEQLKPAAAL